MTFAEKLKYLIEEHLKTNVNAFSKEIGNKRADTVYNIVNKGITPAPKTLNKIFMVYPEYKAWLLDDNARVDDLQLTFRMVDESSFNGVTASKPVGNEITEVPENDYVMMVQYEDLEPAAGKLGGGDLALLPSPKKRLVPREYEQG